MVLAIVGEKRVGKDQAFAFIKELCPTWERIGLADEIKGITSDILHLPLEVLEKLKNAESVLMPNVTGRTILQDLGQRLKVNFGEEVWCEQVTSKMGKGTDYVITDIRFPFELAYFKKTHKVVSIRILRDTGLEKDSHASETSSKYIPTDYTLDNNGNLEGFRQGILNILKEEGIL